MDKPAAESPEVATISFGNFISISNGGVVSHVSAAFISGVGQY